MSHLLPRAATFLTLPLCLALSASLQARAEAARPAAAGPTDADLGRLDRNQDQRLSLEEFYAGGPPPMHPCLKHRFGLADDDHDGQLTYEQARKTYQAVSQFRPRLAPAVDGALQPISIEVSPTSKRALVKATVNGVEGRFLLDTGTSDTILDVDFARRAKVDGVDGCMGIAAGNYGNKGDVLSFVQVPDLEIAGTHFRGFHAILQDQGKPRSDFAGRLDGLIGANVLYAKPLVLDYRRQQLRFATAPVAGPHDFAFNLVLDRRKLGTEAKVEETHSPVALVRAEIDGVKMILLLDSGAAIGDAILVNQSSHDALRKLANDPQASQYTAKEVRIDGQPFLANKNCLLRPFEESVIGAVFFDHHVVTVDVAAGKVFIDRNRP